MQPLTDELDSLALTLFDIGAVQLGKFRLHSGKKSRIYLDLRLLVSFPSALRQVARAYEPLLNQLRFDLLAATPLAGLPIGTALCLELGLPLIYPRMVAKSYGTGKGIEGVWEVSQRVVVVDDLITSGDSILQTISYLKASGLTVHDAVVLIDRQQGGIEMLRQEGYNVFAVMSLPHLLRILHEHERISEKQLDKVIASL